MNKTVSDMMQEAENLCMETKLESNQLRLRSDQLENLIQGYTKDRNKLAVSISDCQSACEKLTIDTQEVLRIGNTDLRREVEQKMCNFTDNLLLEFKYINKRYEDKILYTMGYYKEMPDDERAPRKRPPLKIFQSDFKLPIRPSSAVFTHEELENAMEKAS